MAKLAIEYCAEGKRATFFAALNCNYVAVDRMKCLGSVNCGRCKNEVLARVGYDGQNPDYVTLSAPTVEGLVALINNRFKVDLKGPPKKKRS